jgi:glycosyltransferase involved in cell wall biosynthesis
MKILVITNNPGRASFRQRIGVYLDMLETSGIECLIEKLPAGVLSRRKLFMRAGDFDGVLLHKKTLNPFDAYYLKKYAKKIIYDFDDAIMFDDEHPEKTHHKRQIFFRRTVSLADLVIAGNAYLAEQAKRFNSSVEVLPTGLDAASYRIVNPPRDGRIRLVWIGSHPTLPHLEQIAPALEEIGSRFDNVVLRLISDSFFDLHKIRVEKQPWSLETEVTDLAGCDIGLAPLADNNFTRGKCGFKILQYAAASLPTIASPIGVNRDIIHNGVNGFFSETPEDWIEKTTVLLNNEALRIKMGRFARQMVSDYDLVVIGPRLVFHIKNAIAAS